MRKLIISILSFLSFICAPAIGSAQDVKIGVNISSHWLFCTDRERCGGGGQHCLGYNQQQAQHSWHAVSGKRRP